MKFGDNIYYSDEKYHRVRKGAVQMFCELIERAETALNQQIYIMWNKELMQYSICEYFCSTFSHISEELEEKANSNPAICGLW